MAGDGMVVVAAERCVLWEAEGVLLRTLGGAQSVVPKQGERVIHVVFADEEFLEMLKVHQVHIHMICYRRLYALLPPLYLFLLVSPSPFVLQKGQFSLFLRWSFLVGHGRRRYNGCNRAIELAIPLVQLLGHQRPTVGLQFECGILVVLCIIIEQALLRSQRAMDGRLLDGFVFQLGQA